MITSSDLQKLAQMRIDDAVILLNQNKSSSAYYLAGYSVELALKVCISKLFRDNVIPDKGFVNAIYTHSLESLMSSSGLLPELKSEITRNSAFGANWGIVSKWSESSRYEFWDPLAAATLITAIADQKDGVFTWVKKHW